MRLRKLQKDSNAISEEFTVIPSLTVVLIGIIIAFILFGTTISSFQEQSKFSDNLTTTENLFQKITNPSNPFVTNIGIINYSNLFTNESIHYIRSIQKSLLKNGLNCSLYISAENFSFWFPNKPDSYRESTAVSHPIGLSINEIELIDATLTVIIWVNMNQENKN
jgi:hypothetical protein